MKILRLCLIGLVILLAGLAIAAPIGPLPGFFIGGEPMAAPAQWPDTSSVHEIKLKVPGTLPRVVIIWVIQYEGELYVLGSSESGWVSMIGEGGPVEMRLGDSTYSLNASRVKEGWQPVGTAYVDKYRPDYPEIVAGLPSIDEAPGEVAVFRLARR